MIKTTRHAKAAPNYEVCRRKTKLKFTSVLSEKRGNIIFVDKTFCVSPKNCVHAEAFMYLPAAAATATTNGLICLHPL